MPPTSKQFTNAVSEKAHALFMRAVNDNVSTACLTFEALAEMLEVDANDPEMGTYAGEFASVTILADTDTKFIIFPLFLAIQVDASERTLCVRINPAAKNLYADNNVEISKQEVRH